MKTSGILVVMESVVFYWVNKRLCYITMYYYVTGTAEQEENI